MTARFSVGLRYMAAAALFFSLMSPFVKAVSPKLPTMEVVLGRARRRPQRIQDEPPNGETG